MLPYVDWDLARRSICAGLKLGQDSDLLTADPAAGFFETPEFSEMQVSSLELLLDGKSDTTVEVRLISCYLIDVPKTRGILLMLHILLVDQRISPL